MNTSLGCRISIPWKSLSSRAMSKMSLTKSFTPYYQLMRLDKPAGFLYLYLPSLAATSVVASLSHTEIPLTNFFTTHLLLFLSSVLMRGAGCSWNDLLDRKLDQQVARTKSRPLARGAITPLGAFLCTLIQLILFFVVQSCIPWSTTATATTLPCWLVSLPFIVATTLYPLMKRITHYPQVFLTIPSSWGIFIAGPALGINAIGSRASISALGGLLLFNTAWTISYDLVYAFQDISDDRKAGIKSIAVKHKDYAKAILLGLGFIQMTSQIGTCTSLDGSLVCMCGIAMSVSSVMSMISKVNLDDPANCAWWFKYGCLFNGLASATTYCSEYALRRFNV